MWYLAFTEHIKPLYCDIYTAADGIATLLCDPENAQIFVRDEAEAFRLAIINTIAAKKGLDFHWPPGIKLHVRSGISDETQEWVFRPGPVPIFFLPWPPPGPFDDSGRKHDVPDNLTVQDIDSLHPLNDITVQTLAALTEHLTKSVIPKAQADPVFKRAFLDNPRPHLPGLPADVEVTVHEGSDEILYRGLPEGSAHVWSLDVPLPHLPEPSVVGKKALASGSDAPIEEGENGGSALFEEAGEDTTTPILSDPCNCKTCGGFDC